MMKNDSPILEVIACTVADAIEAEQGGATRLEVISRFDVGGLTPPFELVRQILSAVKIPVRVMLRESVSFEVTNEEERQRLCQLAGEISELEVDGLVLGFLRNRRIDTDLLARILPCAANLRVTFHRAFEELPKPLEAIVTLKKYPQIDCLLTSGGARDWSEKGTLLAEYQQQLRPEISILVGGGVDLRIVEWLRDTSGIRAFHIGSAARGSPDINGAVCAAKVKEFAHLLGLT
jgi:copper homeostasis protein